MKRQLIKQLYQWKEDSARKPLILQGARQVGKTFLIKQFAKDWTLDNNQSINALAALSNF